jgi:septal ring factor EnvC (AmiA/AmiB activator)
MRPRLRHAPSPLPGFLAGFLAVSLLAASLPAAAAPDAAAKQQQLDALKAKLAKVQADRDRDLQRRDAAQVQLRQSERGLAALSREVSGLDSQLAVAQARLAELQRQQAQRQAALDAEKAALAQQIQAAYMEGRESELKLVLDAEDPAVAGRLLAYYDYLDRARAARIGTVRKDLDALAAVDQQLTEQYAALKKLRDSRAQALADREQQRAARRGLVASLDASIKGREAEMAHLKRDAQSLQSLLDDLEQAMTDIPPDLEQAHRFAALRGRLPWPVAGHILKRYGEARAGGGRLKWDGDLIAAPPGTPVRAVSYGRVVYSDWMPHFGLLLILDHGDGYLSIYAHNESVLKQVGDWVRAGDAIATLGDTGGQDEPGLYFELRHGTEPLDPKRWMRGRL